MRKGIFWCKNINSENPELIVISSECDRNGIPLEHTAFSSKSGENYNHRSEWANLDRRLTGGHPYNYYPRGRVEIRNGKALIFLNPVLDNEVILKRILTAFELHGSDELGSITIKRDGSQHYQYHSFTDDA